MEHSVIHNLRPANCCRKWESLPGSDTVRTCPDCNEKVYRIEGLSEPEIVELVSPTRQPHSALQVSLYRRPDGTVMTNQGNCSSLELGRKLFSWPVFVCLNLAIVSLVFGSFHSLPPGDHASYLFVLAGHLAWDLLMIGGALSERLGWFNFASLFERNDVIARYRATVITVESVTLTVWLILQFAPIPVWSIPSIFLFRIYIGMFLGSLLLAYAIAKFRLPKLAIEKKQ